VLTAPFAIVVDALSFVVSAVSMSLIRTRELVPASVATRQHVGRDIGEGLRVVLGHPLLRATTLAAGIDNFFGWFFGALYGLYLINELRVPPALYGVIIGTGGIGALLGALLAGRAVRRWGLGPTLIGAAVMATAANALTPLAFGSLALVVSMLVASQILADIAHAIYAIGDLSLRQAAIPDRYLGRANASVQVLVGGLGALGGPVAGALGEILGLRLTLGVALAGFLVAAGVLYFSPVRRLREPPAHTKDAAPLLDAEPEIAPVTTA
jgi:MFS family permease